MNNPTDIICDPAAIETATFETLADALIALCEATVGQDHARRELIAQLREGAEHARALEARIQQAEKQRA